MGKRQGDKERKRKREFGREGGDRLHVGRTKANDLAAIYSRSINSSSIEFPSSVRITKF